MRVVARNNKLAVLKADLAANPLGLTVKAHLREDHKKRVWVILHRTPELVSALNRAGFDVPPDMVHEYDWPGMYPPLKHQIKTAAALIKHDRLFVLNGMGTGKTLSALWAADYKIKRNLVKRVLIVAPLSTLQDVWGATIFSHFLGRSYAVLHGSKAKRLKLFNEMHDFYIINPDGLHIIVDALKSRLDINLVIIDELALYRASRARIALMNDVINIGGVYRKAWGLTGEPTPNAPTDAYWQIKLIRPDLSRSIGSFMSFRDRLMYKRGLYTWIPREGAMESVFKFMQPSVRFELQECSDLPEQTYQYRSAPLNAQQKAYYERMLKESFAEIEDSQIEAVNAGVRFSKLQQIACGAVYDNDGNVVVVGIEQRIKIVLELLEQTSRKVLLMIPFTSVLDLVYTDLQSHKVGCIKLDGRNTTGRDAIFEEFRSSPNLKVLVANPKTLSHGITLTEADTTIWFSPITSNDVFSQANARTHRISQTVKTSVIMLYATKEERKIYEGLKEKKRLQDVLLDLVKHRTGDNL